MANLFRKLKCDGAIPKCGPCSKADVECLAKDQMSSRPIPRGYMEQLESRLQMLEDRNAQLESLIKPSKNLDIPTSRPPLLNGLDMRLKSMKQSGMPRSYLGGSSGNLYINGVRDSAMSFLGIEIDVSDMNPTEADFPFAQMLITPKPAQPELPTYQDAVDLVETFFRTIHAFMPTLHRPTIMRQLYGLYNDPSYVPRSSFIVILNGIFANVSISRDTYFGNTKTSAHIVYYRRLSAYLQEVFYHEIYKGELEVLQALNIILIYLRVIKKPAAGWLTVELAAALAVDMGLHRNPRKWMTVLPGPLETEMRKRVFWCTNALSRSIANNLGRPSALREIDCDVDLPSLIDDEFIDDNGISNQPSSRPCVFTPGIEVFKLARITGHINELLYAPNRPDRKAYVTIVEQLETALSTWLDEVPQHLKYDPNQTGPEHIASSMMMQAYHE